MSAGLTDHVWTFRGLLTAKFEPFIIKVVADERRQERGYWNPGKSAEILIHWIDYETRTLLDRLIEGLPTVRLLLLVNYRPEYQHAWGSKTYYT